MRKLVLWGHHIDDYCDMFALSQEDLNASFLEYGCGASAVNAEMHIAKHPIVSCDPLFVLDKPTLNTKVSLIFEDMVARIHSNLDRYDFKRYGNFEAFVRSRREGVATFFADYDLGITEKRYLPLSDTSLPFADFTFDFALSSHYFFADLDQQDVNFHVQAIQELARVAKEVRIFPLIDQHGQTSSFLGPLLLALQQAEFGIEVREVNFKLQEKGNAMLRVWAQKCQL